VIKSPKGWGIGLHDYAVRAPEPWMAPGPLITAPASHQDQVVALPSGARVLAGSDFTPNGMLAYDDQPAISIQLHPEFDPAYAKALIEGRRGTRYGVEEADRALQAGAAAASACSTVTSAQKRYPRVGSVSMNRGFRGSSRKTSRN